MASTQKKPEKTKQTAGKKSGGAKTTAAKGKAKPAPKAAKPAYAPNLLARGIAGAVCLFLALVLVLGMFHIRGTVVDLLCGVAGLYPCGEGAGYAGGIVSAAVDGMRCAEALIAALGAETQRGDET